MKDKEKNKVGEPLAGLHNAAAPLEARRVIGEDASVYNVFKAQAEGLPSMDRFFGTKERTFWTFQTVGWTGYGFLRTFQAITGGADLYFYSRLIVAAIVIGVLMTLLMRQAYRIILSWKLQFTLLTIVAMSGALGFLFSSIEMLLAPIIIPGTLPFSGLELFGNAMFESTTLFAWSAIYFGYHYYISLQEQKEQVLKATAMAHQAQLKMLRYQLNPHFLFNTLNAISTLVLEKSETDANRMLTKLSSFLRYTLVNQPTQRITLDKELHALGLYLDIEKVRFEDRLTLEFDIQESAKDALIPSLILQPLVENAIKYAVAPSIDGGTISIEASVKGRQLHIALKDNGPGIKDINNIVSQTGSGVGIVNTNERLQQIYGADHHITFRNIEPTGLGIFIEIPCERENRA